MTAEGPPPVGSAGLNPSGRALVADSVLGMGMTAAATCRTSQEYCLAAAFSMTKSGPESQGTMPAKSV